MDKVSGKIKMVSMKGRRGIWLSCLIIFTYIFFMLSWSHPLNATTFIVTQTTDPTPVNCDANCSLREAIMAANAAAGPDTIIFDQSVVPGTFILARDGTGEDGAETGDLDITDDLTITGAGAADTIIDGGGLDRVIHIVNPVNVEIRGVTIQNGLTKGDRSQEERYGGGIANGGAVIGGGGIVLIAESIITSNIARSAIRDQNLPSWGGGILNGRGGQMTIMDSTISNNAALVVKFPTLPLSGAWGGGIYNEGILIVSGSTFRENHADDSGGGIESRTELTVSDSLFIDNSARFDGGGIHNWFGAAIISYVTFKSNQSGYYGGGIGNGDFSTLTVRNSTFSGNKAAFGGGGIATRVDSSLTVESSTFSGNEIYGLFNFGGTLMLSNSTFSDNKIFGIANNINGTLEMRNCIIANTIGGSDCWSPGAFPINDSNLIEDGSCNPDFSGDPGLDEYRDNDQPGNGHFLLRDTSLAIDAANNDFCPDTDQLGQLRVDGDNDCLVKCDIGAFEFKSIPANAGIRFKLPLLGPDDFSITDEASGVAFLGTVGTHSKFAVIDDEVENELFIVELDQAGNLFDQQRFSLSERLDDLEGITFDSINNKLYLITSQTKKNRFVDQKGRRRRGSLLPTEDPEQRAKQIVDAPYNDYDRRRNRMVEITLNNDFTAVLSETYYSSENVDFLHNDGDYDAANGLIAFMRNQLDNSSQFPQFGEISDGSNVIVVWNSQPVFGTPADGEAYPVGATIPGGGISLGEHSQNENLNHTSLAPSTAYYYKAWAFDGIHKYSTGGNVETYARTLVGNTRLFINEFMADNDNIIADEFDDFDDWIEIYNPGANSVDIGGMYITDDLNSPTKYQIPTTNPAVTTIPAGDFLLLWADGEPEQGVLHIDFKLSKDGEEIGLYQVMGGTTLPVDQVKFEEQTEDVSEGRTPDGGSTFVFYRTPTPESSNGANRYHLNATAVSSSEINLSWTQVGVLPAIWKYSPKHHDFHPINVEALAYRSTNEMIISLRSPLWIDKNGQTALQTDRLEGNALYFRVDDVGQFLPMTGWNGPVSGITGPHFLNIEPPCCNLDHGFGFRSIEWQEELNKYLIIGGPAGGGPVELETGEEVFSLWSWDGAVGSQPQLMISNLKPYTVRPEGVDIIQVGGQNRMFFVEDRFQEDVENMVHWPISIAYSSEIANDVVSLLPKVTSFTFNPDPVLNAPAGTFIITATFINKSSSPHILNPFFKVIELSGGNLLLNANGGAGGVGATLTPDVGGDGILSPGESFTVDFVIGLQTLNRFRFFVDLLGVPGT